MKQNLINESDQCLICSSNNHDLFFKDKYRAYRLCKVCSIIFVPKSFHVSFEHEKARYDEHNNDPNDLGYRKFLERIVLPIKNKCKIGAKGLDFGCGPTPLLAEILKDCGFKMKVYDSFYADDKSVLNEKYDFIVSTEVFEHLRKPFNEFEKLFSILKKDGILAIMTQPFTENLDFKSWHYKNDRTHICFYTLETFDWLSKRFSMEITQIENDIFIFKK